MKSDNRTYLGIALGAIVLAAYFLYGHKGESTVKVDHPVIEAPAKPMVAAPPPMAPAAPAPAVPAAPPTNP
jgi:hypothetical protein